MDKEHRLSPEYKNAVEVITQLISQNMDKKIVFESFIPKEVLKEGSIICTSKDFKSRNIPSDMHWKWNQVKARKYVRIHRYNVQYEIEFFKLMARPIQNIQYKLWRFNVTKDVNGVKTQFRVLWCEHGEKDCLSAGILEELKFLYPFMDPNIANELWPICKSNV